MPPAASQRHRLLACDATRCVIWIVVVLAVFSVARLLQPTAGSTLILSGLDVALPQLCTLRSGLGIDCPGCGLTRCFVYAARFRLAEAWAMHPIGTLLAAYLAATIPQRLWRLYRLQARLPTRPTITWEVGLLLSLIAAAYVRWAALGLGLIDR